MVAVAFTDSIRPSESDLACSANDPSEKLVAIHQYIYAWGSIGRRQVDEIINVDTYIHVFADNKTYEGGWLNDTIIQRQMEVLNDGFAQSNIHFILKGTERNITSPPNFGGPPDPLTAFYGKIRKGDYRSLNLYYMPRMYGGECSFPGMPGAIDQFSTEFILDGCRMGSDTTPGGKEPFSSGKTTIHEVGHWFGLLHTFKGGCNATHGDYIDDTPAEAEYVRENMGDCPKGRNSCPHLLGLDPIDNYMGYTSDDCRRKFTGGQISRMRKIWKLVRIVW
ncbi:pregnancy-associated plasma protein-A domain-containing protein [Hirsutella rhossiliensis]|uniref:Pregnancy-associated plasma protein-A domain-containing protein n=1 Tax=Hirsutella rhossiliensis TaxID=111463 RepID=A0A9P8MPS6_9HYPO|nr:pregnancy-associated plasma protein-A domain-containing protein [Hirsutella rhossiliensis]KAH0958274.1 pregnancy-associated plasma protein-A domain-containing protein [Hirsutella rhossiliensis]